MVGLLVYICDYAPDFENVGVANFFLLVRACVHPSRFFMPIVTFELLALESRNFIYGIIN